jgi:hypothetical protein
VYEQVLCEVTNTTFDTSFGVDELVNLWDDLALPRHVRQAWVDWLRRHRAVSLSC